MKAAVFYKPKVPVSIEELEISEPQYGEVMLNMVGAGVCRSDYLPVSGAVAIPKTPFAMGHEGAGIVKAIGPGVNNLSPGDKVILSLDSMCGYCHSCTKGRTTLCENQIRTPISRMTKDGKPIYQRRPTFTEKSIVHADACVKVPHDTHLENVCIISCAVITGIGAVINRAKVESGATMAVFGCGGIGLNVIQGGILASASKIIAIDKIPYKLEVAEEMGATHIINASKEDPVKKIKEITPGGVDYAFEAVGSPKLVRQAMDSLRTRGSAVMIGVQPAGEEISVSPSDLIYDRGLLGCFHGSARAREDFLWILDLYNQEKIKLNELISKYRPLTELNEAFDDMIEGKTTRTVITFH
jgi:S-(hydroxymethyl)glutathione dehydrogenase/alcohol dehydrogenase|tara:strand:- start:51 stop:1118 length:1068 start_codon:yes stop_codon:yes gene_type:complete